MTTALITGVAGFIGSNFARYLADRYPAYRLVGVDNLSPYSCRESVQNLEEDGRLQLCVADITHQEVMEDILREFRVDYVVNFAAESHNDRAILEPTRFAQSNALGAQSLLEASRRVGVRRHIHVSTIEVYGEQADEVEFFTEASPLQAKTPYSAAKAAGDLLVRAYMQTYRQMDICLTHCANNYGPYQFPEKLIPLGITNLLRGKRIQLYGDGRHQRDWLHVVDHCRALDLILHREGKFMFGADAAYHPERLPIFDISARQVVSNVQIARLIIEELGLDFDRSVELVADRPNHDRKYLINPAKIERALGFAPSVSLEAGIRQTVRWYVAHEAWWSRILDRAPALRIDWQTTAVAGFNGAADRSQQAPAAALAKAGPVAQS